MGEMTNGTDVPGADPSSRLNNLQSAHSTRRLNQVARARANGVGDHVSLPQLVVCGDQSAGKSSVLEGITGIPFPRQDGLCTRFATEITLRHDLERSSIKASIIPHSSRSKAEQEQMRSYQRLLQNFSELPLIIAEVGELMQLRGAGPADGSAFAEDVLRIEVVGDTGLHLTVVDLPGLISVANEEQTEDDVQRVGRLVDSYIESSRTIILAVVQANNDIANQAIIQRARKVDRAGQRTVGIITKPDLINVGTESRIALLAKNQDTTKLHLGYFLLRNPSPAQLAQGMSLADRKRQEFDFFQSPSWKQHGLDPSRLGIDALREFLQDLLDRHIERELPRVKNEIKALLKHTESQLSILGDERPTLSHMRMFLTRRSMDFYDITQAALNGTYHETHAEFFNDPKVQSARLRAEIHRLNGGFAAFMRERGQKRKLSERAVLSDDSASSEEEDEQIILSKKEFDSWIKQTYHRTRGRELPGNYNYTLLSELFHEQSSRWGDIARDHINDIFQTTVEFVKRTLSRVIGEEDMKRELQNLVVNKLDENKKLADEELQKLLNDEMRQPITYNHYYTDNIQNAREDALKRSVQVAMKGVVDEDWKGKLHVSNNTVDPEKLLLSLQRRVIVNMDDQACAEALAGLNAYYKVALKTFIDNVCRQVVERHVLSKLSDTFAPTTVMAFTDEELLRIASEPAKQKERRLALTTLATNLRESLLDLRS